MSSYIGGSVGGSTGGAEGGASEKARKPKHCSPGANKDAALHGSCLDTEDLGILSSKIKGTKGSNSKETHENLAEHFEGCNSESCWIDKASSKLSEREQKLLRRKFRPKMRPKMEKDPNEWLTTEDIENVLEQYADAHDDVYFYGAVPIDFRKCSVSDLCSFSLREHMKRKENKICIVFNTDESDKDGEHWITMFIEIKPNSRISFPQRRIRTRRKKCKSKRKPNPKCRGQVEIYYFDSFGRKPPSEIKDLVNKVQKQARTCNLRPHYRYNDISHQKGDSQCGMYAIHFLVKLLTGQMTFDEYLKSSPTDEDMIELRSKAFISSDEI